MPKPKRRRRGWNQLPAGAPGSPAELARERARCTGLAEYVACCGQDTRRGRRPRTEAEHRRIVAAVFGDEP
ncbi:MAG: hypothetical protein AAF805_02085 [Planctomycetota bacterium]